MRNDDLECVGLTQPSSNVLQGEEEEEEKFY